MTRTFPDDFPITTKWPPRHPERLQLYSLPTPNGVKVEQITATGVVLEAVGRRFRLEAGT